MALYGTAKTSMITALAAAPGADLDEEAARARINSQLSNDERTSRADIVIENNGSLAELDSAIAAAWSALQTRLRAAAGRD